MLGDGAWCLEDLQLILRLILLGTSTRIKLVISPS